MQPIEQNQNNVPQRAHSSPHLNINRPQAHRALLAMALLITIALCITLYLPASTTVRGGPLANFSVPANTAIPAGDNNPKVPSIDTKTEPEINRKPFGDYPYHDNVQTIEDLKRGIEAAAEVLGSGGRHWEGGGVTGPSETQVKQQFDNIFRIILSKLDVSKYQLHSVKPLSCVVRHEHFALPPMKHSGGRKKSKKAAPAAGVEGFETLSSHFMHLAVESLATEGAVVSSDCSITLPPLWIASCLLYAFSTMRGEDYLLFSGNSTPNSPSIFTHLRRFKDSQCARFMTCGLWTSGQITSTSTDGHGGISELLNQNPAFAKVTSVLLGHFGAHMANLKEIDKLLATKAEILYSSRPSDVSPILVTHRTTGRLGPGPEDTSDLFDKNAEHNAEPFYASFDPIGERLAIGISRNADPKTTVTLPQMSSEAVFLIFRMVAAPRPSAYGLPKLIAFLGDSVERANYFALVSSLRRGREYLKDSSSTGWSSYAAWSTSGMYDGRTLLVVFEDCDFLMSHFVYPFMNADENGNGPMEPSLREAIEAAVQQIIDGNSASYAKDKVLRYTTRDIIRSVLSPFRRGPSQVLQLGTLKWYLSILNKLCEADPTPTRLLCPRLLLYFEFDMKADLPNVALLQEDGGEMFMDLWKTQTCRGKAVPNKALRNSPTIDEADPTKRAHHIRWDESARSVVSLGLVMTSFGFWDHAEPVIVSRLHAMMATDFGAMLAGSPSASSDTIYMHRISTLYHHQKGRDRPYYEAFRKAYLEEGPHTFNDVSTVRQDVDADTKSSTWTALSRNFSFRAGYGSNTSSKEELPGLWMTFNRKGKAISPFQDYVLTPERRTRDAVALPNRDKNIPPLRMMMQVEKMLVEGWASLLHLSKLAMQMTYNILNIRPLPQLPHSLAGKAVPSDPVDQTQLLFDQYRYSGDAYGSVIGYSNSQRNEVLSTQSTQLMKTCPITEAQSSHQTQNKSPPNLWAFDASLVQTLYPFTGTDIVHTDCHFNLNARRTERVRTSHSDGHVLMSEWGLTALFTSLHPLADDDGYVYGEPATSPTNSSKRRWSTVQPVCVDDSPPEAHVTSVEVAVSLERRFFRLMFLNYGCEGNWTINQAYRANATQPSLVDETLYPLAPPECSVLIGQTLHQCRNVMAESENYLRLLHILRVKSSSP